MITNNAFNFNINCMPRDKNYTQDKLQEGEQKRKKGISHLDTDFRLTKN